MERIHASIVRFCLLVLLAHFGIASCADTTPSLKAGIVVEWLTKNSQAEQMGIQPGDILLGWARGDASGIFESPFDLPHAKFEEASRGVVRVEGLRGTQKQFWFLDSDTWGIAARPNLIDPFFTIYQEGQHFADMGKAEEAASRWRTAAVLAEKSSVPWLSSWFLMRIAQVLFKAQRWDASDLAYTEAIERAATARVVVRAELLRQRGNGFDYRNDSSNAQKCYLQMLQEWQKLGMDTMAVSTSLNQVGSAALLQGDLNASEAYFQRALTIAQKLAPQSLQVAWGLSNLGALHQSRGDFDEAERFYRLALVHEESNFPSSRILVQTIRSLGVLAHQRGDLVRANAHYHKALAMAQRLDASNLDEVATVSGLLAECILDQGDLQNAEKYEKRALSIREKIVPEGLAVASSLRNLGKIARIRGDLTTAEGYYQHALTLGERLAPSSLENARFLIGLGYVARDRANFAQAAEYYRRALAIMEKEAPGSLNYSETLADLAQAMLHEGQLDVSMQLYHQALTALENKTYHLGGIEEDRSRYRSIHAGYYKDYVALLLKQGKSELAFQILEGSRARTLLETLSHDHINIHEGVDSVLLDREHSQLQSLLAKSQYRIRLLNNKHTDDQVTALDAEIEDLFEQHRVAEAEIQVKSPKYAALVRPQQLATNEIKQLLDPETTLLEYSLGEEHSYIWVVDQNSVVAYELPKRAAIEDLASRMHRLLTVRNAPGLKGKTESQTEARWLKADADYLKTATNLSRMLLGPVAGLLPGRRLLIVSDGALQYIPFSALPIPGKPRMPLILEHEVVNLPSASIIAELRRSALGRQRPPKAVAVFADPVFDIDDERLRKKQAGAPITLTAQSVRKRSWGPIESVAAERLTRSAADTGLQRDGRTYLNRLIYSRQEAESIMAVTPRGQGLQVLDFDANRASALSPKLADYRIIHFATHGLLDSKHPELSGLVFSMVDKHGRPQDGFLQLQDIYNLNLPVELVVLSACETGLGEEINGEGLIGLTRGFMYAGANRVVASLWSVSDIATSELMARFYKAMEQDKLRPAAALRAAQLQMWKQKRWKSPYYWAAFQLHGEWN